jgi:MoaA/NifB/PqqE/SkfB family radical SAM enzyme
MKPLLLHYYITNRCNSRCSFCGIWKQQPKVDAATDDVLANVRSARKAGCRFVDFTGGEPLLHPDLAVFLRAAKKQGYITSITTNCLTFREHAKALSGLVDLLHFSIDADTAALHNKIRGCDSYASVLESIPLALSNNLAPDLLFTYTDRNIDAFDGVYDIARRNRLMVILDPVFAVGGPDIVSWRTHQKAMAYAKRAGVYLNKAHISLRKQGGNHLEKPLCRAVTSTIVVLPDNRIALPCFHRAVAGVPIQGPLSDELLRTQRIEARALEGRYPFCEGCHINCYFDPSYQHLRSILFFRSMFAKASYAFIKYILYKRPWPRKVY